MIPLSFDTETTLFRPGVMAPELVCLTWQSPGERPSIVKHTQAERITGDWLADKNILFTGANTAYDFRVLGANYPDLLPSIFDAYESDRVTDVQSRQKLLDIAAGKYQGFLVNGKWHKPKYSLDDLSHRFFQERLGQKEGPDAWRFRYGELLDVPIEAWPPEAVAYPLKDASRTLEIHVLQDAHKTFLTDEFRVARNFWWLGLMSNWGLRTNPERVAKFEAQTIRDRGKIQDRLVSAKLVRTDGTRDTKAAAAYMVKVCTEQGRDIPLTEKENVCLDADACEITDDPALKDYAAFTRLGFTLNKDIKALRKGTAHAIHTRYDMAATSRTTSSKPNVQNWGTAPGPRECFEPRRGWVFADNDYPSLELFTLAEVCMQLFGASKLADALNAGLDPHSQMAARILGLPYEEVTKNKLRKDVYEARQTGKVFNFGKPGGLGAASLVEYARALYGVILTEQQAKEYGAAWLLQWPEMVEYFAYVNRLTANPERLATVRYPLTNFTRGGATYCAACNSMFQGLGAHCACRAGWLIAKACYVQRDSVMFGSRPVCFVHDQFITEVRDDERASDVAIEQARLMLEGANHYLPHVPIKKSEPTLMRYWSKEAFPLKREGRLVPWNGEWPCDECHGIFIAPKPAKSSCANHTSAWA